MFKHCGMRSRVSVTLSGNMFELTRGIGGMSERTIWPFVFSMTKTQSRLVSGNLVSVEVFAEAMPSTQCLNLLGARRGQFVILAKALAALHHTIDDLSNEHQQGLHFQ